MIDGGTGGEVAGGRRGLGASPLQIAIALIALSVAAAAAWTVGGSLNGALITLAAGAFAMMAVIDPLGQGGAPVIAAEPSSRAIDFPLPGAVIDALVEPVLIVHHGRVEHANGAALALLGAHILGEDIRIAIRHPAAAERLTGPLDPNASRDPVTLHGLGQRDQRWELRLSPLDPGRRLVQLTDASGRDAADKMRVDFVANASHELRTPLAAILGFIETLSDPAIGSESATRSRFLGIMDGEARRMQRLVDDLMSLSRIEAEKYRQPDEAVDLGSLIAETAAVVRRGLGVRGADVETDVTEGLGQVRGDRAQLSQLLHNLIGNSAKYGRPGTPIRVTLSAGPGATVRLSVADEGEGIAPEHLPRLTERFYRVDSGRSRAMGGTGLGLAIVKHIVERHRGRLDISSELGHGTTIGLTLPLMPVGPTARSVQDEG